MSEEEKDSFGFKLALGLGLLGGAAYLFQNKTTGEQQLTDDDDSVDDSDFDSENDLRSEAALQRKVEGQIQALLQLNTKPTLISKEYFVNGNYSQDGVYKIHYLFFRLEGRLGVQYKEHILHCRNQMARLCCFWKNCWSQKNQEEAKSRETGENLWRIVEEESWRTYH